MPYRPSPNLASKVKISRLVRHSHTSTSQTVRHRPAVPRELVDLTVTDAASRSSEQRLAIASLPTFASAGQYFVVVAPDAEHVDTGASCNSLTYRRRAWCRAEIFSCWARNGTKSMYESTRQGLRSLASDDQVLLEALDVFGGAMTCCQRLGHASGAPCDREALMLPMLGLYAELYRDRRGASAEAYALIEDKKDKLYPRTFAYRCRGTDGGAPTTEELPLFGDLIDAVEYFITLDEADDDDRLLSRAVPDFQPGTNAQRRGFAHHHHCHSSVASKRSLARSLSLGSTNRSSPARPSRALADAPPPARPHISWALPEHKSYLQTSQTHVAVVQRISLPPPDDSIHRLSHDP